MMHIRFALAAIISTGLALGSATTAAPGQNAAKHATVGQTATLTACVEKAEKPGTFILTHVADVPVHPATMGRVVYWLDDVKDVRAHVGHEVRIAGTISEVKQSEMEIKRGDDQKGGWVVELEGPGKDVRAAPEKAGLSSAGRRSEEDDVKTTLVRLKVNEVTMVAEKCPM